MIRYNEFYNYMNILVEPLYIGLIQTLISFVFISGFIFVEK